jgi:hypothetical protein
MGTLFQRDQSAFNIRLYLTITDIDVSSSAFSAEAIAPILLIKNT